MPSRLAYDEAIRYPLSRSRLRVSDLELKEGKVEMVNQHTSIGTMATPWSRQGGFAVVYKFHRRTGGIRALRCFMTQVDPDTQLRYERIGPYFTANARDITAGYRYYNPGIRVKETGQPDQDYPIIEMEWVEGVTLYDRVSDLCRTRDQAALRGLAEQWLTVVGKLRQARIAHGDLAGGNVMVRPNAQLVLVDYDGVFIPEFATLRSLVDGQPLRAVVDGQPDYQHRDMKKRQFNEWMDEFSALVIYTALRALAAQPQLWDKYAKQGDENLLFRHDDFVVPPYAPVFKDIEQINDPKVREAIQELEQACQQPIDQVRFPEKWLDPLLGALAGVEQALKDGNDEQALRHWASLQTDPGRWATLQTDKRVIQLRPQVDLASQRKAALDAFRAALQACSIQQIAAAFTAGVEQSKNLTAPERQQGHLARQFIAAYGANNEEQIAAVGEQIEQSPYRQALTFTPAEAQRVARAKRYKIALPLFRAALASKSAQQIATAYLRPLETHPGLSQTEKRVGELARDFIAACQMDDDERIVDTSHHILDFHYRQYFMFTPAEDQRIQLARRRQIALARFRMALASKRPAQIAGAADGVLEPSKNFTTDERKQRDLTVKFVEAWELDEDELIAAAYEAIEQSPYSQNLSFTPEEQRRIALAQQRKAALGRLRAAIQKKSLGEIAAASHPVLKGCKNLTADEAKQAELAGAFLAASNADDDNALVDAAEAIEHSPHQNALGLTKAEQNRIALARKRKQALLKFRQVAFMGSGKRAWEIVSAYDATLLDPCRNLTEAERDLLQSARDFLPMYQAVLDALKTNDIAAIAAAYRENSGAQFSDFTTDERNRITRAQQQNKLDQALKLKMYGLAVQIAQEIEQTTRAPLNDPRVPQAKRLFIASQHPKQLEAHLQGGNLRVRWQWPENKLVEYVAVIWRADRWPTHPQYDEPGTAVYRIPRSNYEQGGGCVLPVGPVAQVYVKVFSAILDWTDSQPTVWYYSNGQEPTSRQVAHCIS